MLIQPKPYMEKVRLRNHAIGVERRKNMSKLILEHGTPLPKAIEYADIDQAMFKWVEDKIEIVYDGKKLPTYKLYSTQRISEYIQEWDKVDEVGNLIMNFKTVSRDNNPQKGESQGSYFNIPGHKDFAMFYVPVQQENGTEAFDKYTMKQPTQVNFMYSVSIVSNKMEIINQMNELMHYEFNAITAYISPNDHYMSMNLEDVSDNSEYAIDDRKYYLQTYKIKVKGYIIRKEDFKVERIPSRMLMPWRDSDATGLPHRRGKNIRKEDRVIFINFDKKKMHIQNVKNSLKDDEHCHTIPVKDKQKPSEILDENNGINECNPQPNDRYYNKVMKIIMNFDCILELEFVIDKDMILESIETKNIYEFKLYVNEELVNLEDGVKFYNGDTIKVTIERDDILNSTSEITLIGYDPETVFDSEALNETSLEEPITEEHILINPQDDNI